MFLMLNELYISLPENRYNGTSNFPTLKYIRMFSSLLINMQFKRQTFFFQKYLIPGKCFLIDEMRSTNEWWAFSTFSLSHFGWIIESFQFSNRFQSSFGFSANWLLNSMWFLFSITFDKHWNKVVNCEFHWNCVLWSDFCGCLFILRVDSLVLS